MVNDLPRVFDEIAPSWYNYRHHTIFRKELEGLAAEWPGGRLLNLGCGHGADFLPFCGKFELYGVDFSTGMLGQAVRFAAKFQFSADLVAADICSLPFADSSFDFAISVATYHHLRTHDRLAAFLELRRVLKPGGLAFVTVWNRWQPRFWTGRQEIMAPWRTKDKILYRYYNLFTYGSLARAARESGLRVARLSPESSYRLPLPWFSRNICLLVEKW
jgi:SAM-dependent methyltransferase